MPGASKWGGEFLVNTTTTNNQSSPIITALANGRFVAAWSDTSHTGGDSSGYAVRGQVFNANGSKWGGEFLVNTTSTDDQIAPALTALPDGRFVVAWTDRSQTGADTSDDAVRGQVMNADGSKAGGEFLVNMTTMSGQYNPTLAALPDRLLNGRFVVAWEDLSRTVPDASESAVRGRIIWVDGTRADYEFLINTTTADYQRYPAVSVLLNGGFVVTWTDFSATGGDTSRSAVRGQVFDYLGSVRGDEFLVNTTTLGTQASQKLTTLADGRFVVTWDDWSETGGDTSSTAIRGQVMNANGTKSGSEFLVNTTTKDFQSGSSIAALPDGRFVVAWSDYSQTEGDTSDSAFRAQVFNIDGSKSGGEFLVNTTIKGYQFSPAATALPDGRSVVTWTDDSQTGGDASLDAVRGQIFDPRESGIRVSGTPLDDEFVGSRFNDIISGDFGNDMLLGGLGKDRLLGGIGNDRVSGGYGNDTLRGGLDQDTFVFDATLGSSKTDRKVNFDKVVDFKVRDDALWLDNAVFKKLGARGSEDHPAALKKAYFTIGDHAKDKNDYLFYNAKTGVLSYDADGSGSKAPVEIAQLSKHLKLTYHDFFVI